MLELLETLGKLAGDAVGEPPLAVGKATKAEFGDLSSSAITTRRGSPFTT